ncbi:MAG: DUF4080 domain-containing protein [Candidatus Delongbacteria bacterium]|nr:DUF4080 domain-containing protein [Candidatus Delongbacteria bacterium]MBN2834805.1 DUF4080 domain-containing protein [Candidatus Delongbacteria bacterium]
MNDIVKIVLLGLNARYSHSMPALYYLSSVLNENNISNIVLEFSINKEVSSIIQEIKKIKTNILGISVYIWNKTIVSELLTQLSKYNFKIILGGPEVSYNQMYWKIRFPNITIISGYGEYNLLELFGVSNKKYNDFAKLPYIYKYVNLPYTFKDRMIYYESSRGCKFRCSYCLSSRSEDKLQEKDIKEVLHDLESILESGWKGTIKFVDRTFNLRKGRAREIWKFLIEKYNGDFQFHFEIHPSLLDDEDIEFLKNVPFGYFRFEIGIQSIHEIVLKEINRSSYNLDIYTKILNLIKHNNIHIHLDMIVGLPFENMLMLKETFNRIISLKPNNFQVGFLKLLSGTVLYENIEKYNYVIDEKPPYEIISNRWLNNNEINTVKKVEDCVETVYNSGKFRLTIDKIIDWSSDIFTQFLNIHNFYKSGEWQDLARMLIDFNSNFMILKEEVLDYFLTLDWYSLGVFRYKPNFLKTKSVKFSDDEKKRFGVNEGVVVYKCFDIKEELIFLTKNDYLKDLKKIKI